MSKTIISPVKHFAGEVVLSDPLTFPQVFAFEDALAAAQQNENATLTRFNGLILPGVLACVEEFRLENIPAHPTVENFPATPRKSSAELIGWLIGEVSKLYKESEEVPNA